ncbi:Rabphilin-3A effector domain protein [Dictyocaulus viviparus]|uniref:Rabphilin-3A effector domain protein n=1 Tax=Dictyocaulus viviparus TaxID=29172 RepID=A0A0D8Y4T1_DICVI|nr:Rabphilin-3A effector domain protein [Dictyocaulus viviparus]
MNYSKMVDRLEKMRRRATGNGVTHCLLCHTEFGLLASKSYAAMCNDCRKYFQSLVKSERDDVTANRLVEKKSVDENRVEYYVCQRNCGVETLDCSRGEVIFLCKICSEAREVVSCYGTRLSLNLICCLCSRSVLFPTVVVVVLWKKSGAWFYKELPEFVRPEANGSVISPPTQHKASWTLPSAGPSSLSPHRRHLPQTPSESTKSSRPRIQPSWVKEKVMSSMSVNDDDRSSSEDEFVQPGMIRRNHKSVMASRREDNLPFFARHSPRISDTEEELSPDSRASTRSTSPRRSLATPSSYDSAHNQTIPPTHPEDVRSIDSGVVQSDHSNPQQAMTLSVSSLAPFSTPVITDAPPVRKISQTELPTNINKVTTSSSTSGGSLVTPPPIPPRMSPVPLEVRRPSPVSSLDLLSRKLSISSAASTKRAGTSNDSMNAIEPSKQSVSSPLKLMTFFSLLQQ